MVEESGKDRSVACPNGKALRTICNWREGATSGTKLTSLIGAHWRWLCCGGGGGE